MLGSGCRALGLGWSRAAGGGGGGVGTEERGAEYNVKGKA